MRTLCPLALCLASALSAQDMVGLTYSGLICAVDSSDGTSTLIAPGLFGANALARDDNGTLWTVGRTFLGTPQYFLTRIDPSSFTSQVVGPSGDIRALAYAGGRTLHAIQFLPGNNLLLRLDTSTGISTYVGATGEDIEGMTMLQGTLYAWSVSHGLGTLDAMTGAFTDVGPAGGSPEVQWLAVRPDGQLIGGGASLFTIDPASGVRSFYAATTLDLRGLEATGMVFPYGAGCEGVQLAASGTLLPGSQVTTLSTGYPSTGALVGMAGALILGTSRTGYQGINLPLNLDPLLGTNGCFLHCSVDSSRLGFTTGGAAPSLFFPIQIPPAVANQTFYLQHAGFDFTGDTFWSNGIQLHVGL